MDTSKIMNPQRDLDEFTRAYIECALWSSVDDNDGYLDSQYCWTNFATESLQIILDDCEKFQLLAGEMIFKDLSMAGHDFWLTRNHHGSGFWDGNDWDEYEDKLTELAQSFREVYIYIGDDGKLYLS